MVLSTGLKDERMLGIEEGREEGKEEKAQEVAINMLKKCYGLDEIIDLTNLTEAEIRSLAQANGLEVKE